MLYSTMTDEYQVQATSGKQTKSFPIVVERSLASAEVAPPQESPSLGSAPLRVLVDGKELFVEAQRFDERGNAVSFSVIDKLGRQRRVDLDGVLPDLRVSIDGGEPIALKVHERRDLFSPQSPGSKTASGDVRAAMPGKVVKLLCKVGDLVKAGQGLLIIEAMKMENELRAPATGKIMSLGVREGQTVESGQALVTLATE